MVEDALNEKTEKITTENPKCVRELAEDSCADLEDDKSGSTVNAISCILEYWMLNEKLILPLLEVNFCVPTA